MMKYRNFVILLYAMDTDSLPWPSAPPFKLFETGVILERPFAEEMLSRTSDSPDDTQAQLHESLGGLLDGTSREIILGRQGLKHMLHYLEAQRDELKNVPPLDQDSVALGRHMGWIALIKEHRPGATWGRPG